VRSTLIVHDAQQRRLAESSVGEHRAAGAKTTVETAGRCWKAPEDQQHYLAKQRMADAAE
jgi:peptide methionine sulfoxide reductase MsrA